MPQGIRVDPTDFIYRLAQLQGIFQGTALAYNNIFQTPYGRRMRIMFFNAGAATNILRVGQFQTSSTSNDSSFSTQLTYAMGMGNIANIASAALGNCTVQVQFDDVSQSNLAVADLSVVAGALTFGSLTNMVDDNLSTSGIS